MRRPCPPASTWLFASALLVLSAALAPAVELRPYHALDPDPKVVALTPGLEGAAFADLLDRVEAAGYHVPLAYVGAGLVLLDAPGLDGTLRREAGVSAVLREPARGRSNAGSRVGALLHWWNEGFDVPVLSPESRAATGRDVQICTGVTTLAEALAARGSSDRCSSGDYGTVHFAAGRVVVNLILPEYRGPYPKFWTPQEEAIVTSELQRALSWWNLKSGRRATFVLVPHGPIESRIDPATVPIGGEIDYLDSVLLNMGYDDRCGYTMVHQLNEDGRTRFRGHFGVTQFILHADRFPSGVGIAYAYLGGPLTVALLENGGHGRGTLDRVIAHEFGHIFQGYDEYLSGSGGCPAPCNAKAGYLDVPNQNCLACPNADTKCVMRGTGEYSASESAQMEEFIHPCEWTKGAAGLWDKNPANGVIDVLQTVPETRLITVLPDTIDNRGNYAILGEAWDQPYPAPARYTNPVTINAIREVQYSISAGPWRIAHPSDGLWSEIREEFEVRLPELGGGWNSIAVRAVNIVGAEDFTPAEQVFFVYDVVLRKEFEGFQDGSGFALSWAINGDDFDSIYRIHRLTLGGEEVLLAELETIGDFNERYFYYDASAQPGRDYVYRLEVDIPGKGIKPLGSVRLSSSLPEPPSGTFVTIAPNPSRSEILFSVTVPVGPTPGVDDIILPPGGAPGEGGAGSRGSNLWREAKVAVYDVQGRLVRDLGSVRQQETKRFNMAWDGKARSGLLSPPGVYFLSVDFGYARETNRVVIMR